jgi:hypothetical protein
MQTYEIHSTHNEVVNCLVFSDAVSIPSRNTCTHTDSDLSNALCESPPLYLCQLFCIRSKLPNTSAQSPKMSDIPRRVSLQELHKHTASLTLVLAAPVLCVPCRKFSTTLLCVGRAMCLKYCSAAAAVTAGCLRDTTHSCAHSSSTVLSSSSTMCILAQSCCY